MNNDSRTYGRLDYDSLGNGWWPLARSRELQCDKPLARRVFGLPLVLFRNSSGEAKALLDRCPHRSAPLSQGKILAGEIQCPYHGWRFNDRGVCSQVPGLPDLCSKASLVKTFACREHLGLVWVTTEENSTRVLPSVAEAETTHSFFITDSLNASLLDTAENFLDGFHTHFVHKGWIRRDNQRQTFSAHIRPLSDGIEVEYSGEQLQNGLISRWLEGSRGSSKSRFRLPNLAEIEYRDRAGRLTLLASLWLTPEDSTRLRIFARVATRKTWLPATVKQVILQRLFNIILQQDKSILQAVADNKQYFNSLSMELPAPLNCSYDFIGPVIAQLLNGEDVVIEEKTISISL